jgi:hypothetical protein
MEVISPSASLPSDAAAPSVHPPSRNSSTPSGLPDRQQPIAPRRPHLEFIDSLGQGGFLIRRIDMAKHRCRSVLDANDPPAMLLPGGGFLWTGCHVDKMAPDTTKSESRLCENISRTTLQLCGLTVSNPKVSAMAQIVLRTTVVACIAGVWLTVPASSQTGTQSDGLAARLAMSGAI